MENNLKTLKDIDIQVCRREGDDCLCVPDFKIELREHAKQWIISFQLTKDKTTNIADSIIADRKIELFKEFFNLKEVNHVE